MEVEYEDGDGFDGVAGGFEDLEAEAGEFEGVAVSHGDELVLGFGLGAEADVGSAAVAEFEMAGEEVGVEVGEEDVADVHAELVGVVDVLLDVSLGVDDDGGVAGFVGDGIGCVGEAAEVVLLEEHLPIFENNGEASLLLLDEHGDDVADMRLAMVPASMARRPSWARSLRRLGTRAPMPPIWMPMELRFAKPQRAKVVMVKLRGERMDFCAPRLV